ncbi:hypothetical protein PV797_09620 [Clostridiaceae bacterium M8S5]|nr:hypothetical protein PV797_09620 [Clostridiaceae bacterium M8S5]
MGNNKKNGHRRNNKDRNRKKYNYRWIIIISIWTFLLAIVFALVSENLMRQLNLVLATIALIFIITLGVFFDIIGIAVASANETPFHAMAADGIKEAKFAVRLIRHAPVVSNFCNDVIGDICGVLSGAAGAIIAIKVAYMFNIKIDTIASIVISAISASLTVGGKAIGKEIGINNSDKIILKTAKILYFINQKLGIDILPELRRKR